MCTLKKLSLVGDKSTHGRIRHKTVIANSFFLSVHKKISYSTLNNKTSFSLNLKNWRLVYANKLCILVRIISDSLFQNFKQYRC